MGLAGIVCLVAGLPERFGHGGHVVTERNALVAHTRSARRKPCKQRRPRRRAEWIRHIGAVKDHTACRQSIDVGRPNQRMARVAKARRIVLIGSQD